MKIAYVLMQFPVPSETFASTDISTLLRQGVNVEVFSLKAKHKNYDQMTEERGLENLPIHNVDISAYATGIFHAFCQPLLLLSLCCWLLKNEWKKPQHLMRIFFLIAPSFFILSNIKKSKPDVVHLFWGHYPSIVGYLVNKKFPTIQLTMFLGAYDMEMSLGISRSIAQKAVAIFTHARSNTSFLEAMGIDSNRIKIIYRGIDIEYLSSFIHSDIVNKKGDFITASRLIKSKRLDKILFFLSSWDDRKIAIAGDGPEYEALAEKSVALGMRDRVNFLGFLKQSELIKKMVECRFFILLSDKKGERLPNVVKEAMLAGCVCIVSRTPGIDELINDRVNGFIIESEMNLLEVKEFILSRNEHELNMISKNAKERIIEKFDSKSTMSLYLSAWIKNAE